MLYFIPWVVLLLLSILAIPIASMLDKRKEQLAYAGGDSPADDTGGAMGVDDDEPLVPLDSDEPPAIPVDDASDGLGEEGMIEVPEDSVEAFGTDENAFG